MGHLRTAATPAAPVVPSITVDDAAEAARCMLAHANHDGRFSIKLCLWIAVLSANTDLRRNGAQAQVMRRWVDAGLPSGDDEVIAEFARRDVVRPSGAQLAAFRAIEDLEWRGELAALETRPRSPQEWLAWRQAVVRLPQLSWKTASFAALLLWPFDSPLVPVDRHVCKRLGYEDWTSKISDTVGQADCRRYTFLESLVQAEAHSAGHGYTPAIHHWWAWSYWRQLTRAEPVSGRCESHDLLSPYFW